MFKKFFNKKKVSMPEFPGLESSTLKDKFFVRIRPWDWLTEKEIYVAAKLNDRPTMITMEYWPQQVYLLADGQITVSEFIHIVANRFIKFNNPVPDNFDVDLLEVIEEMVNEMNIIKIKDVKTDLAADVAVPMSQQINRDVLGHDIN